VKIRLVPRGTKNRDGIDYPGALYEGETNTIVMSVPKTEPIVSSDYSKNLYEKMYIRFLRHESHHSSVAAINSRADCDPLPAAKRFMKYEIENAPSDLINHQKYDKAIQIGDNTVFEVLGKLVEKRKKKGGFNNLDKSDQTKYNQYQELFKHYIPSRDIVIIDYSYYMKLQSNGGLRKIKEGKTLEITQPGLSMPIFIDEIHYEIHPEKGKLIVGSGYYTKNPKDVLEAIVTDVKLKQEIISRQYKEKYQSKKEIFNAVIATTEHDAMTVELEPEVLDEFYPELMELHVKTMEQSPCQPTSTTVQMKL